MFCCYYHCFCGTNYLILDYCSKLRPNVCFHANSCNFRLRWIRAHPFQTSFNQSTMQKDSTLQEHFVKLYYLVSSTMQLFATVCYLWFSSSVCHFHLQKLKFTAVMLLAILWKFYKNASFPAFNTPHWVILRQYQLLDCPSASHCWRMGFPRRWRCLWFYLKFSLQLQQSLSLSLCLHKSADTLFFLLDSSPMRQTISTSVSFLFSAKKLR